MQAFAAGQISDIPINEIAKNDIPVDNAHISNGVFNLTSMISLINAEPGEAAQAAAGAAASPAIGDLKDLISSVQEVLASQHAIDTVQQATVVVGNLPTDGPLGTSIAATADILKYVDESIALQLKAASGAARDDAVHLIKNATNVIHFEDRKINTDANAVSSCYRSYYVCFQSLIFIYIFK